MIAVGIVVGSQLSLQILDAIDIVTWDDYQINLFQDLCAPLGVVSKLSEQC
jgi:hypothetical protein